MTKYQTLVHEYRGNLLDTIHNGYLAIVDENSRLLYHIGDPDTIVFYRSASKPLQAIPIIMRGLDRRYGLTDEETIIFGGSHCGDQTHIAVLESIVQKVGIQEEMLIMKPAIPARRESNEQRVCAGLSKRKLYHNCAGKHIALAMLQRELNADLGEYHVKDAPAQTEVHRILEIMGESHAGNMHVGIDGCGVPVFATGLRHIAIAFKNLAVPEKISDDKLSESFSR